MIPIWAAVLGYVPLFVFILIKEMGWGVRYGRLEREHKKVVQENCQWLQSAIRHDD